MVMNGFGYKNYGIMVIGGNGMKIPERIEIARERNEKSNWKWKIVGEEHSYNISTPEKIVVDKVNEIIKYLGKEEKGLIKDEKYSSQFYEECNTDWNLNYEFIHWVNYWFKVYLENADTIVDLEYRRYTYAGEEYSQKEIIEEVIKLTDEFIEREWELGGENELNEKLDEIFDLFRLVFWNMWW